MEISDTYRVKCSDNSDHATKSHKTKSQIKLVLRGWRTKELHRIILVGELSFEASMRVFIMA